MVDFDLYILAITLISNNVIHSSNYNADLLQKRLKETFELDISRFTKFVASETADLAKAVSRFFSPRAVQVNCEMHQLNSCLNYGFRICDDNRIEDMLDGNEAVTCN